jgi:hypothetical protein
MHDKINERYLLNFKPVIRNGQTFLRYAISALFDQSLEEVTAVDATEISTPLDSVPLYAVKPLKVSMILLKSSQAVSSSDRFSLGTPVFHITSWLSL